jgi:polar amino acid transport system permease protein
MYFTFFVAAGLIYLMITLVSQRGFMVLERRVRRGQRTLA